MTRIQMREINAGAKWRETVANAFGGQGSMGNGSAMRVAPLGGYFADDLERCAEESRASSLVTHTHPEGVAGAIAVAVAAAVAWQLRDTPNANVSPDSSTRFCISLRKARCDAKFALRAPRLLKCRPITLPAFWGAGCLSPLRTPCRSASGWLPIISTALSRRWVRRSASAEIATRTQPSWAA